MARLKTRVTLEGVAGVQNGLRDPQMLAEPMRELYTAAARIGQRAATDRMDGGLGIAVRSVFSRIDPNGARVASAMDKARSRSIDQGRKPGQPLKSLLPQIIRWKEAVHHPDSAITIAKGIQRRGVKGRFFKRAAVEAVNNALPELFGQVRRGAASWWRRRFV